MTINLIHQNRIKKNDKNNRKYHRRIILPYNPRLKELAKKLRKDMTLSEVLLWNELKQKQMLGFDFDRQRPIDEYIVDFYCKDLMLAIEVDGESHDSEEAYKTYAIECENGAYYIASRYLLLPIQGKGKLFYRHQAVHEPIGCWCLMIRIKIIPIQGKMIRNKNK